MHIDRSQPLWNQQHDLVNGGSLVIVDAGANTGQSLLKYRRWWPDATVYCLEPDPRAFADLRATWENAAGVHLHQEALGAKAGSAQFNLGGETYTSSILARPSGYRGASPAVASVDVPVITLDEFGQREGLPYINILKMDLQGFELAALHGAREILMDEVIDIIFTEVWLSPAYGGAPYYWEVARLLSGFGYKTWSIEVDTEYPRDDEGRWGDALFISNRYAKIVGY